MNGSPEQSGPRSPALLCLEQVLKDFGVPAEVTVVSAHRTPDRMLDYARRAAGRGIQVSASFLPT